ncbi:membrane-associated tyrosine- and threonine-specific cdc2-inhibitory kinase-like [Oscarella lobularis]|uniref:membrane-associated tyrosine- and threonine-specific cdc2-inhibitory kinase-like n=1 Tax=Oscarella lobularis TaxID=121494 RepID=UPI0033136DA5
MSRSRNSTRTRSAASPPLPLPVPTFLEDSERLRPRRRSRSEGRLIGAGGRSIIPSSIRVPRSPVKSVPPKSRVFGGVSLASTSFCEGPRSVGVSSAATDLLTSPHYSCDIQQTYFDQCFVVERKIGVGSFGEVFKVRSKEDGKYYAVKKTRQGYRGDLDRSQKIQEVCQHERLTPHPNCVRFYKAWEERAHLYIQTELCHKSLRDYEEQCQGPFDEDFVKNCFADLALGLKHIHDVNLCHFDIKPDNIFITEDNICKIGDFGLMTDISKNNLYDAQEGDPKYLAPELLQNQFGKPADVFSLGMTLLELSCDIELPSFGEAWHVLRSGHIPETTLEGLSPDLKRLLRAMLNPDPISRPTIGQVLSDPYLSKTAFIREKMTRKKLTSPFHIIQSIKSLVASLFAFLLSLIWTTKDKSSTTTTTSSSQEDDRLPPAPSEDSFQPQLTSSFTESSTPTPRHNPNWETGHFSLSTSVPSPLLMRSGSAATTPCLSREKKSRRGSALAQKLTFGSSGDTEKCSLEPKNLLGAFEDVSE